jgi:hypothetical protein
MGDPAPLVHALVPLSERTALNTELGSNFVVREIISWLVRFDIFNRFLNRIYIGGVVTR